MASSRVFSLLNPPNRLSAAAAAFFFVLAIIH
jgi:hypothetical protein